MQRILAVPIRRASAIFRSPEVDAEELLARVIALARRAYGDAPFTQVIKLGVLEIDILKRTVGSGTSELRLSSLEQSLLYLVTANACRVVSRAEIRDALWGVDCVAESNVVDRKIRNLARLEDDWRHPRYRHCAGPQLSAPGRRSLAAETLPDESVALRSQCRRSIVLVVGHRPEAAGHSHSRTRPLHCVSPRPREPAPSPPRCRASRSRATG